MNPLVSVVIPTANRPKYLLRAVDSALAGMDPKDVEVIVVPNGPDESWREALRPYDNNQSVRIIRIEEANANIARNAGMSDARGEFIRFLDDDDYLIPESAVKQYDLIRSSEVDVVSGSVRLVDELGRGLSVWHQKPDTDDLCTAVLGPWRNCLPTAHVYRRSCLRYAKWNSATKVRQDVEWLLDLCASMELKWNKTKDVVGIWQQHSDQRVSSRIHINKMSRLTVPMIIKTYNSLLINGRLDDSRRQAVSLALWGFAVRVFFFDPIYWSHVARTAHKIHPTARPPHARYNMPMIRMLNPLLILWLELPKQWAFYLIRRIPKRIRRSHN